MNKKEFWTTKVNKPEYFTVTYYHPDFGYYRLVADQFDTVNLGGNDYRPTSMTINKPDIGKDPVSSFSVSFSRYVVGRELKQALNKVSTAGKFVPIKATYTHWTSPTDIAFSIDLWVSDKGGITFNKESVTIKATDDNPMRMDISTIFTVEEFTGLEQT